MVKKKKKAPSCLRGGYYYFGAFQTPQNSMLRNTLMHAIWDTLPYLNKSKEVRSLHSICNMLFPKQKGPSRRVMVFTCKSKFKKFIHCAVFINVIQQCLYPKSRAEVRIQHRCNIFNHSYPYPSLATVSGRP